MIEKQRIRIDEHTAPSAWHGVALMATHLDQYDWAGLIEDRRRADSIGHIVDPTGYLKLIRNKTAQKNMLVAKALQRFLAVVREEWPEIMGGEGDQ